MNSVVNHVAVARPFFGSGHANADNDGERPTGPCPLPSNRLWNSLQAYGLEPLARASEVVTLQPGAQLMHAGQVAKHVYFPCSATVSLLLSTPTGKSCEVALIGNDGMVGVHGMMGGNATPYEAVVRKGGILRRLSVQQMTSEFGPGTAGSEIFMRYAQTLMTQFAHTAVCCRHHSVEQRTCRMLLQAFGASGDELRMTHELMAESLGVRRESVTEVARSLSRNGVIRYLRGRITLLDRTALESLSCECHAAIKQAGAALFDGENGKPSASGRSLAAAARAGQIFVTD